MTARGELVSFYTPIQGVRSALAGRYSVMGDGSGALEVRDDLDKLVCRISVLVAGGDSFWLTLQPLRGYDREAERIRRRLLDAGFLSEQDWKSVNVPMRAEERSDVVVARVLLRLLEIQDANLPGALADSHIEFLHDFRVAIRRTRSVLREMRGVFTREDLERVRASFKWLQDETGATRDLDVYVNEFDVLAGLVPPEMRGDLEPLRVLLRHRQRAARASMEEALTGERARELHDEWEEILQVLVLEPEGERPDAARPIGRLAGTRIGKVHAKMVAMGREITPQSPPEDYHELRKKGKELRYLLELFGISLFDADVVRPLIGALKDLQDVLGRHQDREVQVTVLREIAGELVGAPGGAGAVMAIGALIDRLQADAQAARDSFARAFSEFASDAQCKLVTDAFS